jgi:hypothetical protein
LTRRLSCGGLNYRGNAARGRILIRDLRNRGRIFIRFSPCCRPRNRDRWFGVPCDGQVGLSRQPETMVNAQLSVQQIPNFCRRTRNELDGTDMAARNRRKYSPPSPKHSGDVKNPWTAYSSAEVHVPTIFAVRQTFKLNQ